ncbi:MAG: hypothetical protein BAA02_02260 [Paenibacillaceae bacterium ZCTH02-B3]|nr:MAG: hypothetical protein BAA02_02260 [Paenibacillaceae bacterium ZCTH02-B3]
MRKFGRATKAASAVAMALVLLAAGGCLYPRDRTPDGGMAPREAALAVQEAVNRYFETHGTLPLFNADANVPKYEKFRVDFARLKSAGFLPAPPPAAFEGGGPYLFLIVDEERDPKVRLLDLRVWDRIDGVQRRIREFLGRGNPLPAGEEIYPGLWLIDFARLGMRDPGVPSVFSGHILPLMVDADGRVYADYAVDVAEAVRTSGADPGPETDLRDLLVERSPLVPVKSPVYRWKDGLPAAEAPR